MTGDCVISVYVRGHPIEGVLFCFPDGGEEGAKKEQRRSKDMREKDIERILVKGMRDKGGIAIKLSGGLAGMPDRLLLFPGGHVVFVETKAPGKKPRMLQKIRHERLRSIGFPVLVCDSKEEARVIIGGCDEV